MSHFFITSDQIAGEMLTITGDDVNHMKNVLRMRSGEAFTAADEKGIFYHCEVDVLDKQQVMKHMYSYTQMEQQIIFQQVMY